MQLNYFVPMGPVIIFSFLSIDRKETVGVTLKVIRINRSLSANDDTNNHREALTKPMNECSKIKTTNKRICSGVESVKVIVTRGYALRKLIDMYIYIPSPDDSFTAVAVLTAL